MLIHAISVLCVTDLCCFLFSSEFFGQYSKCDIRNTWTSTTV